MAQTHVIFDQKVCQTRLQHVIYSNRISCIGLSATELDRSSMYDEHEHDQNDSYYTVSPNAHEIEQLEVM